MASDATGVSDLADRYAGALFELAEESDALDTVADDLRALRSLLTESAELRTLVRTPTIRRDAQVKGMDTVLEKAGAAAVTRRFVGLVASKRRLFALPRMIEAYLRRLSASRGEITARVTSAKKLTEKQRGSLERTLKQVTGADVAIEAEVDPEVLGGLVVRVGSRMVDSSLRTKLQSLKLAMKGIG